MDLSPIEIHADDILDLRALERSSIAEGFDFLRRLREDWRRGVNRFDGKGEILLGCRVDGAWVGVGGLNKDPYAQEADIGRLRHIYVAPAQRRMGVASALVTQLVVIAQPHFRVLRLRTTSAAASLFYVAHGFNPASGRDAHTHELVLA